MKRQVPSWIGFENEQGRQAFGFTLIELLVVIAIIALLMAVLVPSLRKAKCMGQSIVCRANLRQLSAGWQLYLEDSAGYFCQWPNVNLEYGGWQGKEYADDPGKTPLPRPLNRYVNLPDIVYDEEGAHAFLCPGDRGGIDDSSYLITDRPYVINGTSYQTNQFIIGPSSFMPWSAETADIDTAISQRMNQNYHSHGKRGFPVDKVADPSRVLLMGDYGWWDHWDPSGWRVPRCDEQADWHGKEDTLNMAYLDGRVESVRIWQSYYVTDKYAICPFKGLWKKAISLQGGLKPKNK